MRFTSLSILLFLALAAYGQQQERVAIINAVDNSDSIGFSDLSYLTDRLRETAVNILPKQRYGVMTTESIVAFLGSQERAEKECREASCLADLGRKVSADYVAQARVGRFGENLAIKTELYNVKSGNLIGSFTGNSENIFGLLDLIDEKAPALFKRLPGVDTSNLEKPRKTSFWVAIGLDVLGAVIISVGYMKHEKMWEANERYNESGHSGDYYNDAWNEVESIKETRNALYILGGVFLATGIGVHIWF